MPTESGRIEVWVSGREAACAVVRAPVEDEIAGAAHHLRPGAIAVVSG